MEKPKVLIEIRDVYGLPKAYPVNDAADLFASLVNMRTLTWDTLNHAEKLGFEIVFTNVTPAPKNFRGYVNQNDIGLQ